MTLTPDPGCARCDRIDIVPVRNKRSMTMRETGVGLRGMLSRKVVRQLNSLARSRRRAMRRIAEIRTLIAHAAVSLNRAAVAQIRCRVALTTPQQHVTTIAPVIGEIARVIDHALRTQSPAFPASTPQAPGGCRMFVCMDLGPAIVVKVCAECFIGDVLARQV